MKKENKTKDTKKIIFPSVAGTWGTITHFSFFDRIVGREEVERGVKKGGKDGRKK